VTAPQIQKRCCIQCNSITKAKIIQVLFWILVCKYDIIEKAGKQQLLDFTRKSILGKKIKSFLVQQFFKNAAEVKCEEPLSSPAGDETPRAILRHMERWVRKETAFQGRANKTAQNNIP
jgi:hypothetical protein